MIVLFMLCSQKCIYLGLLKIVIGPIGLIELTKLLKYREGGFFVPRCMLVVTAKLQVY